MGEAQENYESVREILSYFEYGKVTPLRWLSQKTGLTYEALMNLLKPVVQAGLVSRSSDDKEVSYVLRHLEYDSILERCFGITPESETSAVDSVQMRSKNTTLVKPVKDAETEGTSTGSQRNPSVRRRVMASVRKSSTMNERVDHTPEPKPAAEPERRSSMELQFFDRRRSQQLTANVVPGRNIPLTGAYQSVPSSSGLSGVHKSVYINHVSNTHPASNSSRSMYTPPSQGGYGDFRRTDTNFPLKQVSELPQRMSPILSGRVIGSTRTEYSEELIRSMIGVDESLPLFAIDCDKTCFELWSCFSAVANSGGGIILLGVRRHGISYVIRKNPKFDELVSSVIKEFNDRTVISDAPKCRECLDCTDENAGFISKCHDGKKSFMVIRVDNDTLSRLHLPIYTKLDSFGTRKDGCYYVNDEHVVVRCNDEETKALWERFYLKNEQADWDQTGEMLDVDMSRKLAPEKVEPEAETEIYLTSRVLHKGERKSNDKSPRESGETEAVNEESKEAKEAVAASEEQTETASTEDNAAKTAEVSSRRVVSRAFAEESVRAKYAEAAKRSAEQRRAECAAAVAAQLDPSSKQECVQKSLFDTLPAPSRDVSAQSAAPANTADAVRAAMLWAGDINFRSPETIAQIHAKMPMFHSEALGIPPTEEQLKVMRSQKIAQANAEKLAMNEALKAKFLREEEEKRLDRLQAEKEKAAAEEEARLAESLPEKKVTKRGRKPKSATENVVDSAKFPADMPPLYQEAKRPEYDKIAESAILIPRLQAVRVCAIATKLLRTVSLTMAQICDIMKRSQPSIKKNVIMALENDPHFKSFGDYYYYVD